MLIDLVTFTGAGPPINPKDIVKLAEEYSHIPTEWALLFSKKNEGKSARYPSLAWMEWFVDIGTNLNIAGHLNGIWLRQFLKCEFTFVSERSKIWNACKRIQLNFAGLPTTISPDLKEELKKTGKDYIFQMDGVNEYFYDPEIFVPLFDKSSGEGVLPNEWPESIHPILNGYAGGLSPDNLKEQLVKINNVVGEGSIWIDMESGVRSENDVFDLGKCRQVLEIVSQSQ